MAARPRAIFLDALGTLVALAEPWPALTQLLREHHGVDVDEADARLALLAEMRHYRNHCARAADQASLAALRLECAQVVVDELGAPAAAIAPAELVPTLLAALRFAAFDDAAPALERWRAQGTLLVVVSNWDISLHDVLRTTGLQGLADAVITSAEVGHSKPDPAIFAAALERVGLRPEEAVHIGDSFEEDVLGARAAGIEGVLLARAGAGLAPPDGVRVIASLGEW
jgi:putative hydrolase of the HAD superfamily